MPFNLAFNLIHSIVIHSCQESSQACLLLTCRFALHYIDNRMLSRAKYSRVEPWPDLYFYRALIVYTIITGETLMSSVSVFEEPHHFTERTRQLTSFGLLPRLLPTWKCFYVNKFPLSNWKQLLPARDISIFFEFSPYRQCTIYV